MQCDEQVETGDKCLGKVYFKNISDSLHKVMICSLTVGGMDWNVTQTSSQFSNILKIFCPKAYRQLSSAARLVDWERVTIFAIPKKVFRLIYL